MSAKEKNKEEKIEEVQVSEEERMFDPNSNDPLIRERARCLQKDCGVRKVFSVFQECTKRVTKKAAYTAETCMEEHIDLIEAIDKCVKGKAFIKFA